MKFQDKFINYLIQLNFKKLILVDLVINEKKYKFHHQFYLLILVNWVMKLKRLEEGGADMIHVDVMDGHFVPNLTIGPPVIKALRKQCSIKFDVHLMISPVHKYIEAYSDAGADIITIHPEATDNLEESILKIKSLNKKVGVSLNPKTKIDLIIDYLEKIDLVFNNECKSRIWRSKIYA